MYMKLSDRDAFGWLTKYRTLNETGKIFSPSTDGLLLYYSSKKSGNISALGTIPDFSPAGNDAVLSGDAYVDKDNGGIILDGTGDFATTIDNIGISGNGARSIAFWFYRNAAVAGSWADGIMAFGTESSGTWNSLGILAGGNPLITYGFWANDLNSVTTTAIETWYHCVVTFDDSIRNMYINGVLNNSGATTTNTGISQLVIGNSKSDWAPLNGKVDDVLVYNRAITADEITDLYNNTLKI